MATHPLRIGYVPEHFSAPLHFALTHFDLRAQIIPFASGTGHMILALRDNELDIGIGLTEGWIAALGNEPALNNYRLVGSYVDSPLRWAVSTGADREDVNTIEDIKGGKVGVSRVGSGSHVMSMVLAEREGWVKETGPEDIWKEVVPLQTFRQLRQGVRDSKADFFMWEHFTTKGYYESGATHRVKKIGEISTPWPSWLITSITETSDRRLEDLFQKLDQGIQYFESHAEEAVKYISTELEYSEEDAQEWMKTVKFTQGTKGVRKQVVSDTVRILKRAGVLGEGVGEEAMMGILKEE